MYMLDYFDGDAVLKIGAPFTWERNGANEFITALASHLSLFELHYISWSNVKILLEESHPSDVLSSRQWRRGSRQSWLRWRCGPRLDRKPLQLRRGLDRGCWWLHLSSSHSKHGQSWRCAAWDGQGSPSGPSGRWRWRWASRGGRRCDRMGSWSQLLLEEGKDGPPWKMCIKYD